MSALIAGNGDRKNPGGNQYQPLVNVGADGYVIERTPDGAAVAGSWSRLGADKRYKAFHCAYYACPPAFRMPRVAWSAHWLDLVKGPQGHAMPTVIAATKKETETNPRLYFQKKQVKLGKKSMEKRLETKASFFRKYALQILAGVIWLTGMAAIRKTYMVRRMQYYFIWNSCLWALLFFVGWFKAIYRCGTIIFVWLSATQEHTEEAGEVVQCFARRAILSRLMGCLVVSDAKLPLLVSFMDFDKPFQRFYFAEDVSIPIHGDLIESHCGFTDERGDDVRFVWKIEMKEDQLCLVTKLASSDFRVHDLSQLLSDPHCPWRHWLTQPLSSAIDIDSKEVNYIVETSQWWKKLEFQLKILESRLNGWRGYLGDICFNNRRQFVLYVGVAPAIAVALVIYCYFKFNNLDHPDVYLDFYLSMKHMMVSAGIASTALYISVVANSLFFCLCWVNGCMSILETQINKDLMAVLDDVDEAELDKDDFEQLVDDRKECLSAQSIAMIWSVVSCEKSLKSIAAMVDQEVYSSKTRNIARVTAMQYKSMLSDPNQP